MRCGPSAASLPDDDTLWAGPSEDHSRMINYERSQAPQIGSSSRCGGTRGGDPGPLFRHPISKPGMANPARTSGRISCTCEKRADLRRPCPPRIRSAGCRVLTRGTTSDRSSGMPSSDVPGTRGLTRAATGQTPDCRLLAGRLRFPLANGIGRTGVPFAGPASACRGCPGSPARGCRALAPRWRTRARP